MQKEHLDFFSSFIESHLGIVYSTDNSYQLEKRLHEVVSQLKLASIDELYQKAKVGLLTDIKALLLDLATNNETSFFRDPSIFKAIENHIISQPRWSGSAPEPLRIWCTATSTGQEVYSLAMILMDWMQKDSRRKFSFFATDYSTRVLDQARRGVYSQLEVRRGLSDAQISKHFHKIDSDGISPMWAINDDLKRGITFQQLNLIENWGAIGPFDIVLCRNVLIYQNVENKKKIIEEIHKKISPSGYLILGAAESLMGLSNDFNQIELERAVLYQKIDQFAKKAS